MTVSLQLIAFGLLGLLLWSFVEYLIHGFLSHRWNTPVAPLHWGHHHRPDRVFTSPLAWVPAMLVTTCLASLAVGATVGAPLVIGIFAGFVRYEYIHWRIHFREPRNARERIRRCHHLAHHFRDYRSYFGVTTRFWDHVFGTIADTSQRDYAAVDRYPPLPGKSNFNELLNPRLALKNVREAKATIPRVGWR